jgi:hypothetical protein
MNTWATTSNLSYQPRTDERTIVMELSNN